MIKVVATVGTIELITNGNHQYWTRIVGKSGRLAYQQPAGKTLASAMISLEVRAKAGY